MKLKAAFLIGLFLKFGGTLSHFLSRVLVFLLLRGELLDFFLRRLGAVFRRLRPVFRFLQALFQRDEPGFNGAEVRLRVG